MTRTEQIEATRAKLADLQAKDQQRRAQLQRLVGPYAADMEATQAELQRLEAQAQDETAKTQLRGLAAGTKAHDMALKAAFFQGVDQLKRVLDLMDHHVNGIRSNRQKFYDVLETLTPNITKEKAPLGPASAEDHDRARALLSDLRDTGVDLDAVLSSSTGFLSPFDKRETLPTGELGGELW